MISTGETGQATRREHDLLNLLFDSLPIGIAIYDRNLALQSFNPTWAGYVERYALCERARIVPGASLHELTPDVAPGILPLFTCALAGETAQTEGLRIESRGVVSYWDLMLCPLFEGDQVVSVVQMVSDATERVLAYHLLEQRVEERTHEIEKRRKVAESLGETLALINSSQTLLQVLQRLAAQARQLLGADCVAIFNLHADQSTLTVEAFDGAPPERLEGYALPVGLGAVGEAVLKRKPVLIADTRDALRIIVAQRPAESQLKARVGRMVSHYRTAFALPLIVRDEIYGGITLYYEQGRRFSQEDEQLADMFAHQAALAIENARLREQIEQTAVAAERHRIARDLHDSVTQTLFSASLIADVLPRLGERNRQEAVKSVGELRQLVRAALAEMRMLLLELRPATLAKVPLSDLLKHLAEATGGRSLIPVGVTIEGECDSLPRPVHTAIYRIAQEALNNVAKHSGANRAEVTLRCHPGGVELQVADDGVGFDALAVRGEHLGLDIMRERAQEINAVWRVESKKGDAGSGTLVLVKWEALESKVDANGNY